MTKTEQAELRELGLTPETLKAKQRALASVTAQANVSTRGPMTLGEIVAAEGGTPPEPHGRKRKRRSDAGTKRPKPEGRIITVKFTVNNDKQAQNYAKALRVFLDAGDTANVDAMLTAAMRG